MVLALFFAIALSPEQRAIDYLAKEVPRWFRENQCFSCHNDGDGARALYRARKLGYAVPNDALEKTTAWLETPSSWESNRGSPAFSDKKLAKIQFAAALVEADGSAAARRQAAALVASDQSPDGSWQVDTTTPAGSPVTWGTVLASYQLREILPTGTDARSRVDRWLEQQQPRSIPDAAALLLAGIRRRQLSQRLIAAQTSDGGWGPQRGVRAEAFDTGLVLLALAQVKQSKEIDDAIAKGRAFLISLQFPDGGWPATTRPSGSDSYAQHISTTAWAAMALMATDPERNRR